MRSTLWPSTLSARQRLSTLMGVPLGENTGSGATIRTRAVRRATAVILPVPETDRHDVQGPKPGLSSTCRRYRALGPAWGAVRGRPVAAVDEEYLYDPEFYAGAIESVINSARAILPLVLQAIDVRSVVDVGCGLGLWL